MTRLLVHVEGETEETFVNEVLANHLYSHGYQYVGARLLGNCRQRDRRGGIRGWDAVKQDIIDHLRQDRGCIATTMVDYYALPQSGSREWPGRREANFQPFSQKSATVHSAIREDIVLTMGNDFNPDRFIPYVMMHEFEGLLFSDCNLFASGVGRPDLAGEFNKIRKAFNTPEEINDSPLTAPSKRVESLLPNYQKPLLGPLAVIEIGLPAIRSECPLFAEWLDRLENNSALMRSRSSCI